VEGMGSHRVRVEAGVVTDDWVVVCGSGAKFHEGVQTRTGTWRAECGTGWGTETVMLYDDAVNRGWLPCLRCYGGDS
jgi:hypothetical protein